MQLDYIGMGELLHDIYFTQHILVYALVLLLAGRVQGAGPHHAVAPPHPRLQHHVGTQDEQENQLSCGWQSTHRSNDGKHGFFVMLRTYGESCMINKLQSTFHNRRATNCPAATKPVHAFMMVAHLCPWC